MLRLSEEKDWLVLRLFFFFFVGLCVLNVFLEPFTYEGVTAMLNMSILLVSYYGTVVTMKGQTSFSNFFWAHFFTIRLT